MSGLLGLPPRVVRELCQHLNVEGAGVRNWRDLITHVPGGLGGGGGGGGYSEVCPVYLVRGGGGGGGMRPYSEVCPVYLVRGGGDEALYIVKCALCT